MKAWVGFALVVAALTFSGPAVTAGTGGTPRAKAVATSGASDLRARRIFRDHPAHVRYANSPTYFARPNYYAPYPYGVPAPFFLGFAYLPNY